MTTNDERLSDSGRADAASETPSSLLSQISNEMVRAQKTFFGRGPVQAKSYLLDDFLLIVMRGGLLPVERTMLDAGKQDTVRQYRQDYENEMTERLVGKMEELTGRKILTYQSQILFDPDIVIEIFFFDESVAAQQLEATVKSLTDDSSLAEASPDLTADRDG
jgi:uncharacterized protein YbcI